MNQKHGKIQEYFRSINIYYIVERVSSPENYRYNRPFKHTNMLGIETKKEPDFFAYVYSSDSSSDSPKLIGLFYENHRYYIREESEESDIIDLINCMLCDDLRGILKLMKNLHYR